MVSQAANQALEVRKALLASMVQRKVDLVLRVLKELLAPLD